ncbi:MAG: glucose-1-phosphate cytidylyltransferase [Rhodopirellula sp.]|nr:glucose-1-phosphate cytidylyltransferase [Rhodopirellula sp.]|tara:strand:+ start:19133 stop:19909 length:777 start_codon:yes stop_codon:yes gene_type:complete
MKAVILAGGLGTRLSEETELKPKPMIEIGSMPILWHVLKIYSAYGINDFIICCGYKGYIIKEYFANYFMHMSDVTIKMSDNSIKVHQNKVEPWNVTLVDTGENTMTGGRLKQVYDYIKDEESFCFTYGDGVGDVDISNLIKFHNEHGKLATLTATRPPGRYGAIKFGNKDQVENFQEKPDGDGSWINGGFFVLNPKVINRIKCSTSTIWEQEPLSSLAIDGELYAYKHDGFWQPMDTLREKNILNNLWNEGNAPWKIW